MEWVACVEIAAPPAGWRARTIASHTVESSAAGTRATLGLAGPLGLLVGFLTRDLTRRYLDLEAAGLRKRSEAG